MTSEAEPPHISMKQAMKLAGWKPAKNQTRSDLLVYGGWLKSRWEWSRDIDVSLDQAIANSRRLGEDVRIVGNPKPADRKKVRGRKPLTPKWEEPPPTKVPERPPIPPLELMQAAPPAPPAQEGSRPEDAAIQPSVVQTGGAPEGPSLRIAPPAPKRSHEAKAAPDQAQASSLLLQRFLIAASLCSVALFLGYYQLAGTLYVSILLIADAFFIVVTSLLALRNRRAFGGRRRETRVGASEAQQGSPQAVA